MKLEKFLEKVEEKTGVSFSVSKNGDLGYLVEGEYWSDLGEDVIISLFIDKLTKKEVLNEMSNYVDIFDAEEHATEAYNLRGKYGTPTSLRALLKDADEQQKQFTKIYETMRELA